MQTRQRLFPIFHLLAYFVSTPVLVHCEPPSQRLPAISELNRVHSDWLLQQHPFPAGLYRTDHPDELALSNGLVTRTFRLAPNGATVGLDNRMTGEAMLRSVRPEAHVTLNGTEYAVGGLTGQPDHAYLLPEWLDAMTATPAAFTLVDWKRVDIPPRLSWDRVRSVGNDAWPPQQTTVALTFAPPAGAPNVQVTVYHSLYDGLPLICTWLTIENRGADPVRLNTFTSDILALVEPQSSVEAPDEWRLPNLHVESDYAFGGMDPEGSGETVHWVADPDYETQVNYRLETPALLEVRPSDGGPDIDIPPGQTFTTFRTWELLHDSTDRERNGLAARRMYRAIAPWATENPLFMHVRSAKPDAVRLAIDQCAEVGFEMVIMTFGSGFSMENEDPAYLAEIKSLVDYGKSKGIALGGYSLLASRRIDDENDIINPETGTTGGTIFGNSPCLGSEWGADYFRKVRNFIETSGVMVLEHDGSYPGDRASTTHPGHRDLGDSQWTQWKTITDFYEWCRARGVYLNVPDWYFLKGSNKTAMGYRETNWSLPRAQQLIHGRQNLYDGTWAKAPSMGWMFVPLVEYHGGGPAATIEPLQEHLDTYEAILTQNFAWGAQAAYRGPRLFDTDQTKAMVARRVAWYKDHRAILESDIIHLRRADGRDWDGVLHVNPNLAVKGMAVFFNPTAKPITRTIDLPLYYTGLQKTARVRIQDGRSKRYRLDRDYAIAVEIEIPPRGSTWLTIE